MDFRRNLDGLRGTKAPQNHSFLQAQHTFEQGCKILAGSAGGPALDEDAVGEMGDFGTAQNTQNSGVHLNAWWGQTGVHQPS